MDSMRTLNTSLPRPPRNPRLSQPPEQLIQAFKNAALSVTNLYRTAEADENHARQAGYQEALDDLLIFLDKKNIGLNDGEGWIIRQWATERLDSKFSAAVNSDSDEEQVEAVKPAGNISPLNRPKSPGQNTGTANQAAESPSLMREQSTTVSLQASTSTPNTSTQTPGIFTFRSSHPQPPTTDAHPPGSPTVDISCPETPTQCQTPTSITVNVLPRSARPSRGNRQSHWPSTTRNLGSGAGSKRRIPFGDYFDLGSLEGPGGGSKRGRTT